jgi:HK97 family phage prohead protease
MKITIQGIASVYNVASDPLPDGRRRVVRPGAFDHTLRDGAYIQLRHSHDAATVLGSTRDTLKLWNNRLTLDVQFELEHLPTIRGIAARRCFGLSCSYIEPRAAAAVEIIDGDSCIVVAAADLFEISIVAGAKVPGCFAWLSDSDPRDWPSHERAAIQAWRERRAVQPSARARSAPAARRLHARFSPIVARAEAPFVKTRPAPETLASVDAALALLRPTSGRIR